MLGDLARLWPRETGQGWDKCKFHEQLHVPKDISKMGNPEGWNSSIPEKNHIFFCKRPARTTQRRRATLDQQVAQRVSESYMIDTAYTTMQRARDVKNGNILESAIQNHDESFSDQATKGRLIIEKRTDNILNWEVISKSQRKNLHGDDLFQIAAKFFVSQQNVATTTRGGQNYIEIQFSNEYQRNNTIFRSHPDYRSEGPWHDWVMIKWRMDNARREQPQMFREPENLIWYNDFERDEEHDCYTPAKIVGMFLKVPIHEENGYTRLVNYVMVWPCSFKHQKKSVFTTSWTLDFAEKNRQKVPNYYFVECDSIVRHCLMIPGNLKNPQTCAEYIEVWPRERWADEFLGIEEKELDSE